MTATVTVLKNAKVFCDWMDLSSQENDVALSFQCDELSSDAFNVGAHVFSPGLTKYSVSHKGYLAYGLDSIEEKLSALNGLSNVPLTLSMPGNAGDIAYFMKAAQLTLNRGMQVGQLASFEMSMAPSSLAVVRGKLIEVGRTVSGNGTSTGNVDLGAASVGQNIYAILHVTAITGSPNITVRIESDAVGFGSPTTKATFTAKTARGSESISVAGPNTDTLYRAAWTFSGTGSATIVVAAGIL